MHGMPAQASIIGCTLKCIKKDKYIWRFEDASLVIVSSVTHSVNKIGLAEMVSVAAFGLADNFIIRTEQVPTLTLSILISGWLAEI